MAGPKVTSLPYPDNEEEKRKFYEGFKDLYKALGFDDAKIEEIINAKMKDTKAEREYLEANEVQEYIVTIPQALGDKYTPFVSVQENVFVRVIQGMLRPENSIENIEYNEMIARKLQSRKGCVEVLQEAATILATADKQIYEKKISRPKDVMSNLNAYRIGFVAKSFFDTLDSFRMHKEITEEEFPVGIQDLLKKNKLAYERAGSAETMIRQQASLLHLILPEGVPSEKLYALNGKNVVTKKGVDFGNAYALYLSGLTLQQEMEKERTFVPETPESLEFYQDIQERMNNQQDDYKYAAQKAYEDARTEKEFLLHKRTVSATYHHKVTTPNKDLRERNQKRVDDRFEQLKDRISANYEKTLEDALDEVYTMLRNGNMRFHRNKNYKAMLDAVNDMKTILSNNANGMSDENEIAYAQALNKLQKAADEYLITKGTDNKLYSNTALDRIDAAKMCAAFAKGRMTDRVLDQNVKAKTALENNPVYFDILNNLQRKIESSKNTAESAMNAYEEEPNEELVGNVYRAMAAHLAYRIAKDELTVVRRGEFSQQKLDAFKEKYVNNMDAFIFELQATKDFQGFVRNAISEEMDVNGVDLYDEYLSYVQGEKYFAELKVKEKEALEKANAENQKNETPAPKAYAEKEYKELHNEIQKALDLTRAKLLGEGKEQPHMKSDALAEYISIRTIQQHYYKKESETYSKELADGIQKMISKYNSDDVIGPISQSPAFKKIVGTSLFDENGTLDARQAEELFKNYMKELGKGVAEERAVDQKELDVEMPNISTPGLVNN